MRDWQTLAAIVLLALSLAAQGLCLIAIDERLKALEATANNAINGMRAGR